MSDDGGHNYAALGNALGAIAQVFTMHSNPAAKAAGQRMGEIATLIGSQANVWQNTYADHPLSDAELVGGIVASTAAAYLVPTATMAEIIVGGVAYLPFVPSLAPIAPMLVLAVAVLLGYYFGEYAWDAGVDLANKLSQLLAAFRPDPIVLDLDNDGIELRPLNQSATMFDLDDDGVAERVGWVAPDDGLLVHDANGNGLADGISELLGSANIDGYDELKTLDANADNKIDALDPAFAQLRVWRDLNADGVSTTNEMFTADSARGPSESPPIPNVG